MHAGRTKVFLDDADNSRWRAEKSSRRIGRLRGVRLARNPGETAV